MLSGQLLIGSGMMSLTVILHVGGILVTVAWLRSSGPVQADRKGYINAIRVFSATVVGVFVLHTVEIWCWAFLYLGLDQFQSLERALYFSTVTFTTLGYGDITLEPRWQLLSGLEAANGVILFGVSTAFIFAVLKHLFEAAGITGRQ